MTTKTFIIVGKNLNAQDTKYKNSDDLLDHVSDLCVKVSQYIPNILVTLGAEGVLYCTDTSHDQYVTSSKTAQIVKV